MSQIHAGVVQLGLSEEMFPYLFSGPLNISNWKVLTRRKKQYLHQGFQWYMQGGILRAWCQRSLSAHRGALWAAEVDLLDLLHQLSN